MKRLDDVRFQHPLGVAIHAGRVVIADTNNHAIRAVNARGGVVATVHVRQPAGTR